MLTIRRFVAFSKAKIDDVNCALGRLTSTNKEVVRLDVSVDDAFLVNGFDALDHLNGDVQTSLQIKLASTFLEQVLETLA